MFIKTRYIALAAAVISGLATSGNLVATTCSSSVIQYQASGTFGANVIKGLDTFKLAGEPFSITLYACESKTPSQTGPNDDVYSSIELTGTVKSSLITTPYTIKPTSTTLIIVQPPTGLDSVQVEGNLTVFGSLVSIHGDISLPAGTLTTKSIAPFPTVSMVTAKSAFTYSYPAWQHSTAYAIGQQVLDPAGNAQKVMTAGTSGTTAPVWNDTVNGTTNDGTVVWSCEGPYVATELSLIGTASGTVYTGAAKGGAVLHPDAVQVITEHADGSQSVRPIQAAPVEVGVSADTVRLQFYGSGLRDASEVHVQIGGQDVPVLYFGASGHFQGLDEVVVEVPHSLAGMGAVDVAMTVDGQAASPVRIHIR
jgi:hypothetical protein